MVKVAWKFDGEVVAKASHPNVKVALDKALNRLPGLYLAVYKDLKVDVRLNVPMKFRRKLTS